MTTLPKILMIEDDEELAQVYKVRFEAEGFAVDWAMNGEQGLAKAVESKPDLIILDVMMPRVSGFDVLDILRNTPQTAHVKVIIMSALSSQKDVARAKSLGVDDYIIKSQVAMADVIHLVKKHLGLLSADTNPNPSPNPSPDLTATTPTV